MKSKSPLQTLRRKVAAERLWYRRARRQPLDGTNHPAWHFECDRAIYVLKDVLREIDTLLASEKKGRKK
jgi:hypothetical protein